MVDDQVVANTPVAALAITAAITATTRLSDASSQISLAHDAPRESFTRISCSRRSDRARLRFAILSKP
jgi:hypothetical protein